MIFIGKQFDINRLHSDARKAGLRLIEQPNGMHLGKGVWMLRFEVEEVDKAERGEARYMGGSESLVIPSQ